MLTPIDIRCPKDNKLWFTARFRGSVDIKCKCCKTSYTVSIDDNNKVRIVPKT